MGIKRQIEDHEAKSFKMRMDDEAAEETPVAVLQKEIRDDRVQKLNQRLTLLTILLPCIVSIIIVIAYIDISKRVIKVHDTGNEEIQKLTQEFETKIADFSTKSNEALSNVEKKASSLENSTATLKDGLGKTEKNATKLEKQVQTLAEQMPQLKESINKIEAQLASVSDELKLVAADRQKLDDVSTLSQKLSVDLEKLRSEVNSLNKEVELSAKADDEQKKQLQRLIQLETAMEKKQAALEKRLDSMDKAASIPKTTNRDTSPVKTSPANAGAPAVQKIPPRHVETQPSPQTTDNIIEQDIKE